MPKVPVPNISQSDHLTIRKLIRIHRIGYSSMWKTITHNPSYMGFIHNRLRYYYTKLGRYRHIAFTSKPESIANVYRVLTKRVKKDRLRERRRIRRLKQLDKKKKIPNLYNVLGVDTQYKLKS